MEPRTPIKLSAKIIKVEIAETEVEEVVAVLGEAGLAPLPPAVPQPGTERGPEGEGGIVPLPQQIEALEGPCAFLEHPAPPAPTATTAARSSSTRPTRPASRRWPACRPPAATTCAPARSCMRS